MRSPSRGECRPSRFLPARVTAAGLRKHTCAATCTAVARAAVARETLAWL